LIESSREQGRCDGTKTKTTKTFVLDDVYPEQRPLEKKGVHRWESLYRLSLAILGSVLIDELLLLLLLLLLSRADR
jgi:hypothetical protein